ncbi:GNAT family N-acetyltransferase [bacterium]|nr:GNAT family N-acetyltransferase [bacterium]
MSQLSVREAIPEDAARFLEINGAAWLATYPVERNDLVITREDILSRLNENPREIRLENWRKRLESMDDTSTIAFACELDGLVVGYCVLTKSDAERSIKQMYVLPEYHNKGIGSALMMKALEWLEVATHDAAVNVASYNENAIKFYEKAGFVKGREIIDPIGELPSGAIIPEIEMIRKAGGIV